jgi:hypothetical protein
MVVIDLVGRSEFDFFGKTKKSIWFGVATKRTLKTKLSDYLVQPVGRPFGNNPTTNSTND